MATLYTHQESNRIKTWLLMVVFLVLVVGVGWFASWWYNSPVILYVAVIVSIAMNFFSYWYSDKIVLRLTGARPASREEYFDLYTTVENLSITAGLPMPKVYIIEDPAPNAFATGRDPHHAVVAVTTGLLSMLEKNELEGVIAHELSHIGNRDMLVSTVAVVLVGVVAVLSDLFVRLSFFGRGSDQRREGGVVVMMLGIVALILAPIAATLLQLAISRKREFLADASGALLTRYPAGLANALRKISAYTQPLRRANTMTAHLFFANPFGRRGSKQFLIRLFSTHPPVEDRIRALMGRE